MPTSSIIQVMPAAQPIDLSLIMMMAHNIVMKPLVVKVDNVKTAKLVMALNNIVIVALSDSLLEVMAMPDSNSYNNSKEFKTAFCTEIHMHITDQFSYRSLVPGVS